MKRKLQLIIITLIAICILIIIGNIIYNNYSIQEIQRLPIEIENEKKYERFKTEGTISNVTYKIHDNYNNYHFSRRGYYIDSEDKLNAPYYYIITMGERRTGGYSIFITDLKIDENNNVEVIVHETAPKPNDITTQAFTYPACCLELNTYPNNIVIKNTKGEVFYNLK